MELKAVEIATYRKPYAWALLLCIISLAGSFILVKQGYTLLIDETVARIIKFVFLFGTIGVAALFSSYMKKQKQKIIGLSDLDEKLICYQKVFRSRLWFYFYCCIGSAFVYYVTTSKSLFYFGLFDLCLMLI